jgi:hypothetical protein
MGNGLFNLYRKEREDMSTLSELMVSVGADISDFTRGMSRVSSTISGTTKESKASMNSMSDGSRGMRGSMVTNFDAIGGALAGLVSTHLLTGFVKDSLNSASQMKAVEAQFTQVFGNMQGEAQKSINSMGKDFGMLPSRLKAPFSTTTSMFKGLGYTTQEAMGMARDSVTLAADAAAFYDKSYEDANSSLNSFIKGNYEGGEAVGLFANETQLAEWASKNLNMTWKDLDEAQKQFARLEYAKAMQENAGATGQAKRESNTYTNQLGNLTKAWDTLKGTLVTPILANVTNMFKNMTGAVQGVADKFKALNPNIQTAILVGGLLAVALVPLLITIGLVAQGVTALVGVFGLVSAPVLAIIAGIGLLVGAFVLAYNKIEPFKDLVDRTFFKAKELILSAIGSIVSFVKSKMTQLQKFWDQNGTMILQVVKNVWNAISPIIEVALKLALKIVKFVWNSIKGVIDGALNIIMGLIKVFAGLFTGNFDKMWEGIKQLFSGAIKFVWNLMNLSFVGGIKKLIVSLAKKGISLIKGMWDDIALRFMYGKDKAISLVTNLKSTISSIFNGIKSTASSVWNGIKSAITKPIESAKSTVLGIIKAIKGAFSKMKITIPKPKLPKVSVAMRKGVMGIPYPDFNVSWNAKGGIFNGASILGGGQGVGEKGAEAVLPIQHKRYMKPFANAVADHLEGMNGKEVKEGDVNINVASLVVREEADIDRIAQKLSHKRNRVRRNR